MTFELPAAYVTHLVEPHGIGDVSDAHAVGEVGSMVGGLGVRVSLAYATGEGGLGRVCRAAGRAFGSAAPLAPISWLTQRLLGATWEEACEVGPGDVLQGLGASHAAPLPEPVARAAEFVVRALRRALGIAPRTGPSDPAGQGVLVCRCLGVGDRPIRRAIHGGAHDPEAVGHATSACTGCRSCRPDVLALIDEELRPPLPPPAAGRPPLERIALARVGPLLRGLGLPLAGAEAANGTVRLRLDAPRPGACISPIGAVAVARHLLREVVHEDVRVVLANGAPPRR